MERMLPMMRYITVGSILVFAPLMTALTAGILLGVFKAGLGGGGHVQAGRSRSWRTRAGHHAPAGRSDPAQLRPRSRCAARRTWGSSSPCLEEGSFLANFLGAIDLFVSGRSCCTVDRPGVLYRRKTGSISTSLVAVYAVIASRSQPSRLRWGVHECSRGRRS